MSNFDTLFKDYYKGICGYANSIILRRKKSIGKLWMKFPYTIDDLALDSILSAASLPNPSFDDIKIICTSIIEKECQGLFLSIDDSFKTKTAFALFSNSALQRQKRYEVIEERIQLGKQVFFSHKPKRLAPDGMQWCADHKQYLDVNLFYTDKMKYCKDCTSVRNKKYNHNRKTGAPLLAHGRLKGAEHPKYSGDYVINGVNYRSSYEAAKATGMNYRSIQRWCKDGKNGCSFIPVI